MQKRPLRVIFNELKRRRVPQTVLWYGGSAIALVEAANVFLPSLGAPESAVRLLAIVAVFGLPIAIALAWSFDVSAERPAETRGSRAATVIVIAAVSLVSVFAGFAVWNRTSASAETNSSAAEATSVVDPNHIAVLAFNSLGEDPQLAAFASQLQTRLIDGLSTAAAVRTQGAKRLRVVSRASVLPFSGGRASVDSIRNALSVGTVLDGTVEPVDGAVRVSVRLVDTQTGDQLAATTAVARSTDRVALLDAIADSVVRLIRTNLGAVMRERMRLLETRSPEAFDHIVLANQRLDEFKPAFDEKDYARAASVLGDADSLFATAERLDPKWIEPILERARMTEKRVWLSNARGGESAESIINTAIRVTGRALAIAPGDYRALEMRGYLRKLRLNVPPHLNKAEAARTAAAAEQDLRAALLSNPTPAKALRMLSELAGDAGRMNEAISYGKRAYDEDPYLEQIQFTMFRLFEYSFALDNDADAAKWCADGAARFKEPIFYDCGLSLAAWSNQPRVPPDSAWQLVKAELASYPPPLKPLLEPRLNVLAAATLARAGNRDSALAVVRRARAKDRTSGLLRAAAGVYGLLGHADSAVAILRMLPATETNGRVLSRAPELRTLRGDSAFVRLIASLENN